jgi:cyclopropane fatty-acyl-phospholipid synthase-like methyltransferase
LLARLLQEFRRNAERQLTGSNASERIEPLYKQKQYLDAYSEHTNIRVTKDPHQAVGGMWEEIGKLQLDFLVAQGLLPAHKFLDIGCGTLRGGRHLIRYLDAANYTGMDISRKAIEYGKGLIRTEGLSAKRPMLHLSKNKDLKFEELKGKAFDYLLAQSVFTHLMPEHIEECFQHVGTIMATGCRFFFTFIQALEFMQGGVKDFMYTASFFDSLAEKYGFNLVDFSIEYGHPRGQKMVRITKH